MNQSAWNKLMCTSIIGEEVHTHFDYATYKQIEVPTARLLPYWELVLKIFFYLVAFTVDIVGNSSVVFVIYMNKRMHNTTNMLIMNLAVSDILVALFCMWVHLGNHINDDWPFGPFLCKFETFIQVIAVVSSILTLAALSLERFIAILFPLKVKVSPRTMILGIFCSWLIAIGISIPNLFVRQQIAIQWKNRLEVMCSEIWTRVYIDNHCNSDQPGRKHYYIVVCVIMYFVPVLIMLTAYTIIAVKLLFRRIPGTSNHASNETQDKIRRKVLRLIALFITMFIICWTPQQALILYQTFKSPATKLPGYFKNLQYAALFIAYGNSAVNPIIYAWMSSNFRQGLRDGLEIIARRRNNRIVPETHIKNCRGQQNYPETVLDLSDGRSSKKDQQEQASSGDQQEQASSGDHQETNNSLARNRQTSS